MSETASGFVRIATLVMMTAVFAVVWRGDQQTQQQFIVARKAAAERELLLAERSAHGEAARLLQLRTANRTAALQTSEETIAPMTHSRVARVEIEMELPAGIAPGTYQVVDQSGQMQKVRISTTEQAESARDLYVLDEQDGRRRYFIRISEAHAVESKQTASNSPSMRR